MNEVAKEKVEYDGYYFIDVVAKGGYKMCVPARGFNLKSWLNFEKSLGSTCVYRTVTEKEWMATHWTRTPYDALDVPKKATKKATAKTAVKQTSATQVVDKKTKKGK
jgi:hypothetical protein